MRERNQGTLKIGLTGEEYRLANQYLDRLSQLDSINVRGILSVVDRVARPYLESTEVDKIHILCGSSPRTLRIPVPFFSAYAVGGTINKQGERPDIDIMVATNMRYESKQELHLWTEWKGNRKLEAEEINERLLKNPLRIKERFLSPLIAHVRGMFDLKLFGKIPYSYSAGHLKDKLMVRLTPSRGDAKPIDLIYVNAGDTSFVSEKEFDDGDKDLDGTQLPKLVLYRAYLDGYVPPKPIF